MCVRRKGRAVTYEEFKTAVREICQGPDAARGLLPIPDLRLALEAQLDRQEFDDFLLRLHREGLVHLLSHVEPDRLSDDERAACLRHPSGMLAYWAYWV